MNLFTVLFSRARAAAPAMHMPDGATWTYADLEQRSAQYAHALVSAGLQPGDRVAVQTEKSAQAVALYLGTLRAGGVFLPLNTGYQKSELAYFIDNAQPRVIVGAPDKRDAFAEIAPNVARFTMDDSGRGELFERANAASESFATIARADDDLASILYTSGTTGRSKGAMITHRNLAANAQTLVEFWGVTSDDVLLHMLPIYHVHGLFVALHSLFLAGGAMHFEPKFELKRARALLPKSTMMMGVPTFYTRLLTDAAFGKDDCKTMRVFISGSAPLLAETHIEFSARTGQAILERYGMTETGMNTSNPLNGERIAGTVGVPLPGVAVRVRKDDGAVCNVGDADSIGGIEVKGANIFPGYWQMPEKNKEEFTEDGYFKTGDMGQWLANGYLQIVGRAKDLIITGGLNVYPKEIEEKMDALDGVLETAVIGIPHPDFGEAVVAVVVAKPNCLLDEAKIVSTLKADLASFKVPKRVHIVAELPRNAMGKVQKNVLRQTYGG